MANIYIVGFMGSGKSFTGKRLAASLGYAFADIDTLFEEAYHYTIQDFFARFGEALFRSMERDLLYLTAARQNTVISTGGGTPCFFGNMDFIRQKGKSIYLKMSAGQLHQRLIQSKRPRPLIHNLREEDLRGVIEHMLEERERFYLQAEYVLDITRVNPAEVIRKLMELPGLVGGEVV